MLFIRTLLIVIFIFYAFELIVKWIFRWRMKKLQQRMDDVMQQGGQNTQSNEDKTPHLDPNIGEYTDFEEVE